MIEPLDGPSLQTTVSVTDAAVVELKVGANPLGERKVVTIQPTGKLKVFLGNDNVIPNAATVQANGFTHFKDAKESYEAGEKQRIWVISLSGTISVTFAERA